MFARLKSWLHRSRAPDPRKEAQARRVAAFDAVNDAYARGDTRDQGRAQMAFVQATSDLLRLEVGR